MSSVYSLLGTFVIYYTCAYRTPPYSQLHNFFILKVSQISRKTTGSPQEGLPDSQFPNYLDNVWPPPEPSSPFTPALRSTITIIFRV